jgi:O-antigen/teichoic acid export membrane protein
LNPLKKFISDTAIYGVTHTVGRLLNFLLVPLYTHLFLPEEYGVISVLYSVVGFANVILLYGMETAFFNFTRSDRPEQVFSTGLRSVLLTTILFGFIGWLGSRGIANFLEYPDRTDLIQMFVIVLALDALSALPLAWLRHEGRPLRFGAIRLSNIAINIGSNLFFLMLVPYLIKKGFHFSWYDPNYGIGYIVVSNLLASAVMFVLLLPQWKLIRFGWNSALWKRMIIYAYPLIFVGLAGIVNETLDRVLLKKLLANDIADFDVGVYSAFYKLSIVLTVFIQAFRFGAEPFFFQKAEQKNSKEVYAKIMRYFVLMVSVIFLVTSVFAPNLAPIIVRRPEYFNHPHALHIVPILLLANLFLGILFNLNFWYKLSNKTFLGMWISIGGAILTIVLNMSLIPYWGILGSAFATLAAYGSMAFCSYLLGRKHYPIPYPMKVILTYISASVVFVVLVELLDDPYRIYGAVSVVLAFGLLALGIERPFKKA